MRMDIVGRPSVTFLRSAARRPNMKVVYGMKVVKAEPAREIA